MLFRYCCPLKSLNVLRIIANKQQQTLLEWYDYTSLGGCVIPMWFMTSNWSYIEFSRHIPMYPQNTFTLKIREI